MTDIKLQLSDCHVFGQIVIIRTTLVEGQLRITSAKYFQIRPVVFSEMSFEVFSLNGMGKTNPTP